MKKTFIAKILDIRETPNYSLSLARTENQRLNWKTEKEHNTIHLIVLSSVIENLSPKRFRISIPIYMFDAYTFISGDAIEITLCENWEEITNCVLDVNVIENITLF